MKQRIRLSESTLHRIIKESVRRVLMEVEIPNTGISLHNDPDSWATVRELRRKQLQNLRNQPQRNYGKEEHVNYNMNRNDDNFWNTWKEGDEGIDLGNGEFIPTSSKGDENARKIASMYQRQHTN